MGYKIEPVIVDRRLELADLRRRKSKRSSSRRTRSPSSSAAGPPSAASPSSPWSEKDNGLLFYPVQYEGEELSKNIFYTAEAVNQQATPAVDYLLQQGKKKFYLIGTDYVYPQTTNLILYKYLLLHGIPVENIGGGLRTGPDGKVISAGKYVPFGQTEFQQIVADIKQFAASGDACVINTINGDSNVPFFKEVVAMAGLTPSGLPGRLRFQLGGRRAPQHAHQGHGRRTRLLDLLPMIDQVCRRTCGLPRRAGPGLADHRELSRRDQGKARGRQPHGALLRRRLPLEGRWWKKPRLV